MNGPSKDRSILFDSNLNIIFGITLISVLGVASIAPAFPQITAAMGVPREDAAWLISMFTIPGLIFTPLTGALSDRYGRKRILFPCLLLFGLAGGGCFFAPDFRTLLLLRFLQGVGSAPLNALNVALIGDLFHGKERSTAIGYNTSAIGAGTASYPALGGLLAMVGWNYPFLLAFLALPVGTWVVLRLEEKQLPETGHMEIWENLSSLAKSIGSRGTPVLLAASMMSFIIQYGSFLTFLPFFLASTFAATPLMIGLVSSSMSISSAITAPIAGRWFRMERGPLFIASSFFIYGAALFFILHVPGCLGMLVPAVLFGIGQGINIPALLSMLTENSPEKDRAMFLSINSMSLRMGQTVGPIMFGMVFSGFGIRAVFFTGAAMAMVMAVVVLVALKGRGVRSER
jgi:MFS family permease